MLCIKKYDKGNKSNNNNRKTTATKTTATNAATTTTTTAPKVTTTITTTTTTIKSNKANMSDHLKESWMKLTNNPTFSAINFDYPVRKQKLKRK